MIAREIRGDVRKIQRWQSGARRPASVPVLRPVEVLPAPEPVEAHSSGRLVERRARPATGTMTESTLAPPHVDEGRHLPVLRLSR